MTQEARKLRNSIFFVFSFTFLLWLIKALEWAVAMDFGFLGILPRTVSGTMGIVTAPLVHGDVLHLLSNTFPLMLLGISVFYFYDRIALEVFVWIYFMSGFWVWMAARDAYHIGASGLVYGLVSFLFFSGLFRRDIRSLSISLIVIFLYGGMVQGLFPINERISWESHLLGALAGAFCAFFYRDVRLPLTKGDVVPEEQLALQPAMAMRGAYNSSDYQQMQKAVDLYDVDGQLINDDHTAPVVTGPAFTLSYQYQPAALPKKSIANRAVVAYRLCARDITDKRFIFFSEQKSKMAKKDPEEPLSTAAA